MAPLPRSGLFGFLLLLAALTPSAGLGASSSPAAATVDARLSRITVALRQRQLAPDVDSAEAGAAGADTKLAWVFRNGPFGGFRNGWGNGGGWRNGGWFNRW